MNEFSTKKPRFNPMSAEKALPNVTKPVWGELDMNCNTCRYNDQDIDTFPCAKCHTRH
jgi:hypothetical protein